MVVRGSNIYPSSVYFYPFQQNKMSSRRVLSDDLKTLEFETSEDVEVTPTFDNMGMREELLRGVYAYGKS